MQEHDAESRILLPATRRSEIPVLGQPALAVVVFIKLRELLLLHRISGRGPGRHVPAVRQELRESKVALDARTKVLEDRPERIDGDARPGAAAVGGRMLAVEVHSAPNTTGAASSSTAFAESLREILSWDWEGAHLVVDPCEQ